MKSENRHPFPSLRQGWMRGKGVFKKKAKSSHLPRQYGFTLIEVLAVIVIISIIAAFTVSRINFNTNLQTEVDKMKSQLRYVQHIALCGNTFSRCDVNGANCVNMPLPGATGVANNTVNLPTGITVTAGTGTINFDQWGNPGNNNINVSLTDGSTNRGITVTKNTGFVP
jgi:prepilin-type N-terminal cleavage/methylation domain-containing protein